MDLYRRLGRSHNAIARLFAIRGLGILAILLMVSSCARLNSIHRTTDIADHAQVISVDAKQRFLISRHIESAGDQEALRKYCAEPSPDVFSAFAASLSGSARAKAFEAALDAAFSENAATIGIRTQAIQLLRDGMYRICEGVLNGDVGEEAFLDLHRRYQRIMVTLVAIEQLTGAVRPPSVAIQTDALAGRPAQLRELQKALEETREKIAEASMQKEKEGKTVLSSTGGGGENLTCADPGENDTSEDDNCKAYLAATSTLEDEEKNEEALEESIERARNLMVNSASGTMSSTVHSISGFRLGHDSVKEISETVQELVNSMFRLDPDTAIERYQRYNCAAIKEESILLNQLRDNFANSDNSVISRVRGDLGLDVYTNYDNETRQATAEQLQDQNAVCEALIRLITNDPAN